MSVFPVAGPAAFVAAIHHLLGMHPHRALVLGGLDTASQLMGLLHVELTEVDASADVPAHLVTVLGRYRPAQVLLAVIDDRAFHAHTPQTHDRLLDEVTTGFAALGITVIRLVWAEATTPGAACRTRTETGTVPDLDTSTLAASRVAAGRVTYPDRQAIAADLAPTDPDAVTRREGLLRHGPPPEDPVDVVRTVLARAARGHLPTADDAITRLARAVGTPAGCAVALARTVTDPSGTRETWVCLTRALPTPWRADAAVLVAVATYLTDQGVIATVALELAEYADPNHALTDLLRQAIGLGASPAELAELLRRLADDLTDPAKQEG